MPWLESLKTIFRTMIKCVIQVADVHIRNMMRHDEYAEQLSKFVEKCKKIASKYEKDEVRILICGDLVHQKNTISNELMTFCSVFIRQLEEIARVIVYTGNHDLVVNNLNRMDTLTAIFETAGFENALLLDMITDYRSGTVIDDNITWALYSIHDDYNRPDIETARQDAPDNIVVGLYHGTVVGASLPNGMVIDSGLGDNAFEGCDMVMAGDIHKRQALKKKGVLVVYPGSLIQQSYGETVTQHGFAVWDMEKKKHKFVDLESDWGLYDIKINSIEDIDNDEERLLNL